MLNKYRLTDGLDKFWVNLPNAQRFEVVERWNNHKHTLSEHIMNNEPDVWFRYLAWKAAGK
jgi:hypothetical protein